MTFTYQTISGKELTLNHLGQNSGRRGDWEVFVPFYFLTCLKKGRETCSGVDSFGPRDMIASKMLGIMFMTWDFHTSKVVMQVENDTTFPLPQGDMGTAYDHSAC